MKNRFDTLAAGWLLDDSYGPINFVNEDTGTEETEETETLDDDEETEDEDAEDLEDLSDDDLDLGDEEEADAETEETEEVEDEEINPNDIAGRLDAIEDKLDDIADNKPQADEDETFDLDLANPVCPCCGARLNILNTVDDTENIANDEEGDEEGDEEDTEDADISALLAGETPEEDVEGEGEEIETMDDSLDDVDGLGYNDNEYISLDDEADEDEE